MPPAFVLSQDQTLKFIPGPSLATPAAGAAHPKPRRPERTDPYQGLQNARKMREAPATRAAARASLPLIDNLNQQPQNARPRPTSPSPRPKGRCLYPHPPNPVNTACRPMMTKIGRTGLLPSDPDRSRPHFARLTRHHRWCQKPTQGRSGYVNWGPPWPLSRGPPKKISASHPPHNSPSARSSVSICSGNGASAAVTRSRGAASGVR
jgi:hypothetical protein